VRSKRNSLTVIFYTQKIIKKTHDGTWVGISILNKFSGFRNQNLFENEKNTRIPSSDSLGNLCEI